MKPRYLLPSDLLGPGEVVELLGVSRMTLKRWRDAGRFLDPWAQLADGPIWIRVDVEAWKERRAAA